MPKPLANIGIGLALCLAAPALAGSPATAASPAVQATKPRRIVSLNLCADQYLLELADPDQIAGLTSNARNPDMSAAAAKVGNIRLLGSSAEEILVIGPDLVVGAPQGFGGRLSALSGRNYPTLELQNANGYADIVSQIRTVAAAIGHPARGEALIARMNRDLATVPRPGAGKVGAYYQRRGFLTGTGTLVDELMGRVGLVNLAGKLGKPALAQLRLEEMLVARPDFMIVETATDRVADQGTEMLHHPALKNIQRLRLPEAWTVCGGPAYVDAARSLAAQIAAAR